ncbi:hypothetical protein GQ53DRAFT_374084 [Thozetella sp. PMI_491]|nr:hypothetical protein GQ53DRAFT_374084 [Thozetella sp. PMI_491]
MGFVRRNRTATVGRSVWVLLYAECHCATDGKSHRRRGLRASQNVFVGNSRRIYVVIRRLQCYNLRPSTNHGAQQRFPSRLYSSPLSATYLGFGKLTSASVWCP